MHQEILSSEYSQGRRATHALEPLNAEEIAQAVALLKTLTQFNSSTRIISIILEEPTKERILDESSTEVIDREAQAVCFDNARNRAFKVKLNLSSNTCISVVEAPAGAQPTMSIDEQVECEQAVLRSPEFIAALRTHYGDVDPSLVMVDIWSAGNYGSKEDSERRLARPLCFLRSDPTDNGYARPIEGIRPVVDLNRMEVLRIEDYGVFPLPPQEGNYSDHRVPGKRQGIKPLTIEQADGPSFQLEGNRLLWQNWRVVVGFNAREGLTLHDIRYSDGSRVRPILFRASLTEMVVPYGDPSPTQARKNAFDVGEYGMGMCVNSLRLGCDCLGYIAYLDAHLHDSRGRPLTIPNAVCIHEEDYGVLWKHTDRRLPNMPEVRRSRRLVVSSISTVENYEYGFFWYFYQDGNIEFQIKLTGILSLGTVREGENPPFGTMIAPLLYAPNHQHFFNVRLDFSVDGAHNTVQQIDVVADDPGPDNPFSNAFRARITDLETEKQARASLNPSTMRTWKVINPSSRNMVGEPVGYKFFPGDNSVPLASREAWWRKRAGFVNHHVWVTPFAEDERFAAGDYPNQSSGGDGLERWTERDRSISNEDVVLWYTFGHTHIPRPEDYPVMPATYIGFLLKPNGFFDRNPANDLPPIAAKRNGSSCGRCSD
ncbi:MAG TPA: primary-amine oxidase [Candidatus Sulfotelmatobacter sp.]|nr:primary-amine oxidase [Candidatus Sulfotelmatobacter sp.]